MDPKRVLIINLDPLLGEIVERILEVEKRFEVVRVSITNQSELIHLIEQWEPEVLIVDEITLWVEPCFLITTLQRVQELRVIVLNSQVSKMGIYDRREYALKDPDQLITAVL